MKRVIAILAGAAVLAALPLVVSDFYVSLASKILIFAIFAMSLDLLVGYSGLVSLGHAAFFGLAAYTVALLSPEDSAASLWWTLPCAVAAAAAAALAIGVLTLPTRGIFFIMATLAFAQMLYFVFHDAEFAGGSDGRYIYFKPEAKLGDWSVFSLEDGRQFFYFTLACAVGCYLLLATLLDSLFGRVLVAMKENAERTRALGYPIARFRLVAFTIAGALSGLAGYLWALRDGFVNPQLLGWHHSGDALMMVILGGMGSLLGPALGAATLVLLEDWLAGVSSHWLLWKGLFVVTTALFLPHGLVGLFTWKRRNG